MRPRTVLRLTHLWAGLALSLLLLVLAGTGSALVYKEAYWRLIHPELREPVVERTPAGDAAAFRAAAARFGDDLRSVKLPEPGVNAYHLYLAEGEAFLSVGDHVVVDQWRSGSGVMGFLFDLHAHLLAGERGEQAGGVVALLGVFMLVTGVVLWWPTRRSFRLASLLPRTLSRRALLPSHRDLGVLAAPILLVLLLTGGGIVFYATAGSILNGLLPGSAPAAGATPVRREGRSPPVADSALLDRVAEAFPRARLVFYYPPRGGDAVHGFRLKRRCELHPNGRSYLYTDAGGRVLQRIDACAHAAGQRALYAVYPLHAGKTGGSAYPLAVFLGGIALALISGTGAASYAAKLLRW